MLSRQSLQLYYRDRDLIVFKQTLDTDSRQRIQLQIPETPVIISRRKFKLQIHSIYRYSLQKETSDIDSRQRMKLQYPDRDSNTTSEAETSFTHSKQNMQIQSPERDSRYCIRTDTSVIAFRQRLHIQSPGNPAGISRQISHYIIETELPRTV